MFTILFFGIYLCLQSCLLVFIYVYNLVYLYLFMFTILFFGIYLCLQSCLLVFIYVYNLVYLYLFMFTILFTYILRSGDQHFLKVLTCFHISYQA